MAESWTKADQPTLFGGYVAWESAQTGQTAARHVPVFLALRKTASAPASLAAAIDNILAQPAMILSEDERVELLREKADTKGGWPREVRLVAFMRLTDLAALPDWCLCLHVGAPVMLADTRGKEGDRRSTGSAPTPDASATMPVVAVIDDGIAFLNARFRAADNTTRFRAVWLQAMGAPKSVGVPFGCVLNQSEINQLLAGGQSEAEIYRAINANLLTRADRHSTNHRISHGTHVLDQAAGASPGRQGVDRIMAAMPLLAVQLPPAALRDTSGRRLESHIVQALRWLILRHIEATPSAPLIINISLGSLAGPADGTAFLADWLDYEMARHARLTGGRVLRIVAAYGNSRRARLVARSTLKPKQTVSLDWCLQPDDHTPSFAELRVPKESAATMQLRLQPADTALPVFDGKVPAAGDTWSVGAGPVAMITGTDEGARHLVHLAIAPSAGCAHPSAPGRWRLTLTNSGDKAAEVSLRVQRDDTPAGFRTFGRQSWLDHPSGRGWDEETRDWTGIDAAGCPISAQGTAVAFAATKSPGIYMVGADRSAGGDAPSWRATRYTSMGRPGEDHAESPGPHLLARGDDGVILSGRRASGVLTGSTTRLSGTSVGAPAVSRALALYHAQSRPDDRLAELSALLGHDPVTPPSALNGHGHLHPEAPLPEPDQAAIA